MICYYPLDANMSIKPNVILCEIPLRGLLLCDNKTSWNFFYLFRTSNRMASNEINDKFDER